MQFYPHEIPALIGILIGFALWVLIGVALAVRDAVKGDQGNGNIHLGIMAIAGASLVVAGIQSLGARTWGGFEYQLFSAQINHWLHPDTWYSTLVQLFYSKYSIVVGAILILVAMALALLLPAIRRNRQQTGNCL